MKILIFEPNWAGDVILTTPAFAAVKKTFNSCFLGCIVPKRCAELLRYNPFIDEIIEFNERTTHRSLIKKIQFIKILRQKNYDTVILLHRSFTRALICYLAGIKERVAMGFKKRSILLTKKVAVIDKDSIHKQDYYLKIFEPIGVHIKDRSCKVYLSGPEREWAHKLIKNYAKSNERLIALSITTNWAPKNWPKPYFADLIKILRKEIENVRFFITSQYKEGKLYDFLSKSDAASIVDMTGKTTLRELAALYERMDLVIAGDSGPLHLAGALDTCYIGIFGATNPYLTAPRSQAKETTIFNNASCPTPCYEKYCTKDFLCMKAVTPSEVATATLTLLGEQ